MILESAPSTPVLQILFGKESIISSSKKKTVGSMESAAKFRCTQTKTLMCGINKKKKKI